LIILSSNSDSLLDLSLTFTSDYDGDLMLAFSEDSPFGVFNGDWIPFTEIEGEPNYPSMDLAPHLNSPVSVITRLILTVVSLFLIVAVVALAVKCIIMAGQPHPLVARRRHRDLVPNAEGLPGDSSEYSRGESDDESDPDDVSSAREADNPYDIPGQRALRI
jgi:hypothetical protein